jgi:hypothetical protein
MGRSAHNRKSNLALGEGKPSFCHTAVIRLRTSLVSRYSRQYSRGRSLE